MYLRKALYAITGISSLYLWLTSDPAKITKDCPLGTVAACVGCMLLLEPVMFGLSQQPESTRNDALSRIMSGGLHTHITDTGQLNRKYSIENMYKPASSAEPRTHTDWNRYSDIEALQMAIRDVQLKIKEAKKQMCTLQTCRGKVENDGVMYQQEPRSHASPHYTPEQIEAALHRTGQFIDECQGIEDERTHHLRRLLPSCMECA